MSLSAAFPRVGMIGTGEIGRRMGILLHRAGYRVAGFDISTRAAAEAAACGVETCRSIAELSRRSDLIIVCVTDGAALRRVACDPDGLEAHLPAGIPVIDTTSAEPWITREVARALEGRGIPFLDAPVSGGVPAADSGKMNFMVGGDPELLDRVRPVLGKLGPVVTHVGKVGSGHTIKAINMLALASSMLATAELVAVGESVGMDASRLVEALEAGPGSSYCTRIHYPRFILPGNFGSGFTFDLMLKDLKIGIELADRHEIPLFLQRSTYEIYRSAAYSDLRGKDNTCIVRFRLQQPRKRSIAADIKAFAEAALGFNAVIAAETMALGVAAGLPLQTIVDVISASSGDSHALSKVLGPSLITGQLSGIGLENIAAACETVSNLAMRNRISANLVCQTFPILAAAMQGENSPDDLSQVLGLMGEWTGQQERLQPARP